MNCVRSTSAQWQASKSEVAGKFVGVAEIEVGALLAKREFFGINFVQTRRRDLAFDDLSGADFGAFKGSHAGRVEFDGFALFGFGLVNEAARLDAFGRQKIEIKQHLQPVRLVHGLGFFDFVNGQNAIGAALMFDEIEHGGIVEIDLFLAAPITLRADLLADLHVLVFEFHRNPARKQPQLAMTNQPIIEMRPGEIRNLKHDDLN